MAEKNQQFALADGLARQGHVQPAVEACYQALKIDDSAPTEAKSNKVG